MIPEPVRSPTPVAPPRERAMRDDDRTREQLIAELRALRERSGAPARPGGDEPYAHILENMRAMICELDATGVMTYLSPTVSDVLGYDVDEVLGRAGFEWIHPDDMPAVGRVFAQVIDRERGARYVYRAQHKAGHWVWLEGTCSVYRDREGSVRIVALSRDVTEMKMAGDALRDSEDRFRAIAENARDFIAELDSEGRFLFASPNSREIFGLDPEEMLGRTIREASAIGVHPDDRDRFLGGYDRNVIGTGRGHILLRLRGADGSWRWFESTASSYHRSDGALRVVVVARDVSERVRAERELQESEARYRVVIEASRDLISEVDTEGRLVYASPTCKDVLGYEPQEVVGTTPFALVHPDDIERTVAVYLAGVESESAQTTSPYRVRHRDGSWRWLEGVGFPYRTSEGELHFVTVSRDVTERLKEERQRREFEQSLQQAQKLESLGVMAGGIAHDFNNLLTPILGGTTLALMELPPESPVRARLQMIQKAAHRAAALTNQMLAYTGKESLHFEPLNLSKLVEEMGRLVESAVSKKLEVRYELETGLPAVAGDSAQLSQVVMNLITNAAEAMDHDGGRITIRTGTVEADRATLAQVVPSADLAKGTYVFFEVSDTGCGMDEATRERIFDPFFTTKFTGRGLGLAAVLGIVRSHGGGIELDSVPELGTRFRVLLPRSDRSPRKRAEPSTDIESWRKRGTVLVVDDDEGVLDLTRQTLQRAGLEALAARDGREALTRFRERAGDVGLILLDRTMPGASGEEIFDQLRRCDPDVPIVLFSGYSQESMGEQFAGRDLAGFLQKPFLPAALLRKVREILGD
jgi:two-component system cell cycle sensor histidine kinase/response regulator CckA